MTHLLTLSSSPNRNASNSNKLIETFVAHWSAQDPDLKRTHRDIGVNPPAHLDGDTINAFYTATDELTDEQRQLLAYSDQAIAELQSADVIVIGAPMHNFGIPSALKAWIDQVARVGKTFKYTDHGPVGLLSHKQVIVLGARGGNYGETSAIRSMDHQTPYLKTALGFLGLSDVTFIYGEAVAKNQDGMDAAQVTIGDVVAANFASEAA